MTNWRNRPTYIDNWPNNIDYIMFIDENGDSHLKGIKKNITKNKNIDRQDTFFTITGCIIGRTDFPNIENSVNGQYKIGINGHEK